MLGYTEKIFLWTTFNKLHTIGGKLKIKKPVKYFDTEEKAKNYIDNEAEYDKDYYYCELEVE